MIRSRRTKPRPGRLQGEDLQALRITCFERDKGNCQKCGKPTYMWLPQEYPSSFHMAHIQGKRMYGDHLENVETNCGDCHRKYHNFGPSMEKPVPRKVKMPTREWIRFSQHADPNKLDGHIWVGRRNDEVCFRAYDKKLFDGFLDPDCNCSLEQTDMDACPIHRELK